MVSAVIQADANTTLFTFSGTVTAAAVEAVAIDNVTSGSTGDTYAQVSPTQVLVTFNPDPSTPGDTWETESSTSLFTPNTGTMS